MFKYFLLFFAGFIFSADNETSIDQVGNTINIDVEQLGSGNLIGGATAAAGQYDTFRFRRCDNDIRYQSNRFKQLI